MPKNTTACHSDQPADALKLAAFWRRKLAAFLHDTPAKCLDIPGHLRMAEAAARRAGLTDDDNRVALYHTSADHKAAAADRLPFPPYPKIACAFDGAANQFHHPLDGSHTLPFATAAKIGDMEPLQNETQPAISKYNLEAIFPDPAKRARANFFLHWRLWRQHGVERDWRFDFLPADTRIPDHSIWSHIQIVSALEGTAAGIGEDGVSTKLAPAFLKFQIRSAQDFIAAARSIRDLWSGSYLLSWLMAAGLARLAELIGPDAVVFPNLHSQPLFDLRFRDTLWKKIKDASGDARFTLWDSSIKPGSEALRTPNLPNIFLALVPADRAAKIAGEVESAIDAEWKHIAKAVWSHCQEAGMIAEKEFGLDTEALKDRFDHQIKNFLSISWQTTRWPDTLDEAERLAKVLPGAQNDTNDLLKRFRIVRETFEKLPGDDRDPRYYTKDENGDAKLNNVGLAWSLLVALNAWQFDAVRQTRNFPAAQFSGWNEHVGAHAEKDSLTGLLEAVAGGRGWKERAEMHAGETSRNFWKWRFRHEDFLSAPTLVKRLWDSAYLAARREKGGWGLDCCFAPGHFPMPDIQAIADHDKKAGDERDERHDDRDAGKYFAVLALDGDRMGKWVSGDNAPSYEKQLARYTDSEGKERGSLPYFKKPEHNGKFNAFLATRRLVSPGYHLQFSEALTNFALHCARPIVKAHDGRLIYAGGDDVLAILPADTALACAENLRRAFRGEPQKFKNDQTPPDFPILTAAAGADQDTPGFLRVRFVEKGTGQPKIRSIILPGPAADVSAGIAIAHFKAPLQDVVKAAQAAEKRAKTQCGRSSFGITLVKRSGGITHWDNKWDSGAVTLHEKLVEAMSRDESSAKLPHAIIRLLEPYRIAATPLIKETAKNIAPAANFDVTAVARAEITHALSRQCQDETTRKTLLKEFDAYIDAIKANLGKQPASVKPGEHADLILNALIGLCTAAAFAHRTSN
ncbi:MAG: type III-B CRISPR-associated protein Cas10/Cmr2 [Opitutaceae bacterium]|jgi:hypothetical protein|nr:type III-B CRISPR-associated protein Cas10/Cmr2 [Opitutaceae bacterium]